MLQHVARGLHVRYNVEVLATESYQCFSQHCKRRSRGADGGVHTISTSRGTWTASHLILATGYTPKQPPRCLRDAAAELRVPLYRYDEFPEIVTGDEPFCAGKRVGVLGSGNAAFEVADLLSKCAAATSIYWRQPPRFAQHTHYVGDVRAHNTGLLDRYQLKSLDVIERSLINCVDGVEGAVENTKAMLPVLGVDALIFAGGFTTARPGLVDATYKHKFPEAGAFWEDVAEPRRWFAGALMHSHDFRISAGGFVHGFRYLVRAQFRHIRRRHYATAWPSLRFARAEDAVAHAIGRVQNSSGLYQMQDFLTDVLVVCTNGSATYYEELPKKWFEGEVGDACGGGVAPVAGAVLVDFRYANKHRWLEDKDLAFKDERSLQDSGLFIHPVLELWTPRPASEPAGAQLHAPWHTSRSFVLETTTHILEDVDAEWVKPSLRESISRSLNEYIQKLLQANSDESTAENATEASSCETVRG
jgi:hypothetical protein